MLQKKEIKDSKRLFEKVDSLVDPVLQTIPENPQFCLNNNKQLRFFDAETLTGMQKSALDCRTLIGIVDASGPTGIGYILTALPESEDKSIIAGDKVLQAWHDQFPLAKYLSANGERGRQLELYYHERTLDSVDHLFDRWVWDSLPEEVRQIPVLEKQLRECQDDLAQLSEDESDEEIQNEITLLQEQLQTAKGIRDTLNLVEIKTHALLQAQVSVAIAVAEQKRWSELLNFDQQNPDCILSEEQFTALVSQAVDSFVARNYALLGRDESGPLVKHLANRRELQNEKRSSAEGSLRTHTTVSGETHQLSLTEVRDPINRTLFIDTSKISEGKKFLDIIVGACLLTAQDLPQVIQEFIDFKITTDKSYPDNAQKTYHQFREGSLKLPPEQMELLADFGVKCFLSHSDSAKISPKLERLGFLKKSRSLDDLKGFESNKSARLTGTWSP
ncbi:Uncharacterised protein [Legionella wadsworthii]|uniref:Uncharacterized protein n=1 Tax=Legionella wadsworthii TaxID=28088 RepID=A0A378LUK1_9GAMM|nr:hypothetical protein [Legionella wadsworthii]STY31329.1 Uncharacterised protein [Legionella wadsworthii]